MDERMVKKNDVVSRNTRNDARATADEQFSTSQERRRMFREFSQEALPTPPARPGWHYVWLSTTNQYDPIYKRQRMGYVPVKAEEIPGFDHYRSKSGEYEGCVSMNEMILFQIPQEIYQEIMEEYHHYRPMDEEERIKANAVEAIKDSGGKKLGQFDQDDEGFRNLSSNVKIPVFN